MKVLGVIPARFSSERFPGKILANLAGKPLIERVWENTRRSKKIERLIVATDDERISSRVEEFGGEAFLTSPLHKSGTDRIAEVAEKIKCEVVVNIQGDEPFIDAGAIDNLAEFLLENPKIMMASLMTPFKDTDELADPNAVKVGVDKDGFALYFTRSLSDQPEPPYKHIGIYGYQKGFLMQFSGLPQGRLEKEEKLEQLRALEHNFQIKMIPTEHDTIGVDTPEDLKKAEEYLTWRENEDQIP